MPSPPAATVSDFTVVRGGNTVLEDLSLVIERGTITGLLRPSGSGKSTLMRALVGVQVIAGGEILVLGEPAGSEAARARVGYVTQTASVYSDLTVAENLRYFARIADADAGQVDRVLDLVDLEPQRSQIVDRLSGGQRGRVSLAAAMLGEPDLLVMDEPTVGLDPVLRRDLWSTFRRLADSGVTLLVSSHVMEEASECDRLLLMRAGAIIGHPTPEGLLAETNQSDLGSAFLALIDRQAA